MIVGETLVNPASSWHLAQTHAEWSRFIPSLHWTSCKCIRLLWRNVPEVSPAKVHFFAVSFQFYFWNTMPFLSRRSFLEAHIYVKDQWITESSHMSILTGNTTLFLIYLFQILIFTPRIAKLLGGRKTCQHVDQIENKIMQRLKQKPTLGTSRNRIVCPALTFVHSHQISVEYTLTITLISN